MPPVPPGVRHAGPPALFVGWGWTFLYLEPAMKRLLLPAFMLLAACSAQKEATREELPPVASAPLPVVLALGIVI